MPNNQFIRDASSRLNFEMFKAQADDYRAICSAIVSAFKLSQENTVVSNGYDVVFQDYRRGEQVVGLEWDNWSGFIVVAKTAESELLVQEIGEWLLQSRWASEG